MNLNIHPTNNILSLNTVTTSITNTTTTIAATTTTTITTNSTTSAAAVDDEEDYDDEYKGYNNIGKLNSKNSFNPLYTMYKPK